MKNKPFILVIVLLCSLAVIIGALCAMQKAKIFDFSPTLAKIPVVKNYIKLPQNDGENLPQSPLEKENQEIKEQLTTQQGNTKAAEEKVLALEAEKTKLLASIEQLTGEVTALKGAKESASKTTDNTKELAQYYREMKPEAAVKIMNNLDDNTIVAILPYLEKEQAAKILALMDSVRAASITQILLGNP